MRPGRLLGVGAVMVGLFGLGGLGLHELLVLVGLLVALDGPAPGRILLVLVVCHVFLPPRRRQPPIGALGLDPQNICLPTMPTRWTMTVLSTIDLAVAVPTPT